MNQIRWLAVIAAAGLGIFGLSFVDGWISHDRELLGEGYRRVHIVLNAWRSAAIPVLTLGAVAALATGIGAIIALRRPGIPSWLLMGGSVVTLAVIGATLVPIGQDGHASSVQLTPAWLTGVGIGLAAVMVAGAVAVVRPHRQAALALCVVGAIGVVGGIGGRWLGLQVSAGTGAHWSDGSYTRPATADQEPETLTITSGSFEIADRWAGTWEGSGWTVVLTDDPACPDSRGTYHAHGEGGTGVDLRFVKVVDTCQDGARAADLEEGIWARDP